MDSASAERLVSHLVEQKAALGCDLPHRHHVVVESVRSGPRGSPGSQTVLHTFWGGGVNRPFAMALDAAWEERFGERMETYVADDCIVLLTPHEIDAEDILPLATTIDVEAMLRKRLEGSGFFGARFRECAGRAILITRGRTNQRMALWLSRVRSQKLLDAVMGYDDFPILLETWRTCLRDEFELDALHQLLAELRSGETTWTHVTTPTASPFAQSVSWRQINQYMYMDARPDSDRLSKLRDDLLRDVVLTPGIRPTVSRAVIERFELKRQRLMTGYAPGEPREIVDWIKERVVFTIDDWSALLSAIDRDHDHTPQQVLDSIAERVFRVRASGLSDPLIVSVETAPRVLHALFEATSEIVADSIEPSRSAPELAPYVGDEDRDEATASLLGEWLQFYGPCSVDSIQESLGIERGRLLLILEDLIDAERVISGELVSDDGAEYVCDAENFEILLRIARAEAAPSFEPLDVEWLPLFLAEMQGLTRRGDDVDALFRRIEQLACYPARPEAWESDILPARMGAYSTSWLDTLMQESDLLWMGVNDRRVGFCFESDRDMLFDERPSADGEDADEPTSTVADLFPDANGAYDFGALLGEARTSSAALTERLWSAVWRGKVTNDTFVVLRRGIQNNFQGIQVAPEAEATRGRQRQPRGRAAFSRWKGATFSPGSWRQLRLPEGATDLLEGEERNKDHVRLLLERYGILFRELLQRELPPFRWSSLFRSLRIMELSGEVVAGYFFHGLPGLQFVSPAAFRVLRRSLPDDAIYWLNATDPASLCGVSLDSIKGALPKRQASTHVVYRGRGLVMVSQRNGGELTFHVPPDDPRRPEFFGPLQHLLMRSFQPVHRITIEKINGEDAGRSPYVDALRTVFLEKDMSVDYKNVCLYRSTP